ncbi:hypothetical protein ACIO93_35450 [Streptomyces sp. NPDC087903]|uniref:hypothetical protein n=1 Tax=Streptomyces sp. NPDC087903 TaxID=3365819 RepID=UPI0038264BD1
MPGRLRITVARWAEQWAVENVFGIHADFLNDARAPDAIAPHLDELVGSSGPRPSPSSPAESHAA